MPPEEGEEEGGVEGDLEEGRSDLGSIKVREFKYGEEITVGEQASKSGSVQMDAKSLQKSERSMEDGDLDEAFEFLADEGEEKGDDGDGKEDIPVATGNVDDDDRQPIPEGKVIGTT